MVYTTASPAGPPSVTSRLRMSVQPTKPASSIKLLCQQEVWMFSLDKISPLFGRSFLMGFLISRSWLCLKSMCSVRCLLEPEGPCVYLSLEAETHFWHYAVFKQNSKNVFPVVPFDSATLFSFDFLLNFLKSSLATHYIACSFLLLDVPKEVNRVLGLTPVAL